MEGPGQSEAARVKGVLRHFRRHGLFLAKDKKVNPCIGAADVSAVPMSARVVQMVIAQETDGQVNPLMPARGPNVEGVIDSEYRLSHPSPTPPRRRGSFPGPEFR